MKEHSMSSAGRPAAANRPEWTIGLDLGDRWSQYCVLDAGGEVVEEGRVATTGKGLSGLGGGRGRCRVALETGTHSPWVSRLVERLGHEVVVAHARQVRLIAESSRKDDRMDARTLARLARVDPALLNPVRHRSAEAQLDLTLVRGRAALVEARTALINSARGLAKSYGERLPKCGSGRMGPEVAGRLSPELQQALGPMLAAVRGLTEQIRDCDRRMERLGRERYPELGRLTQVPGVGVLTALTYVLTMEDAGRCRKSREAGCVFGLQPKRRDSGQSRPQLGITKEGDAYVRQLLVECAQHILGPFGRDCQLRRWGLELARRGGRGAKRKALVAVARKLAVLLHRLWVSGEKWEPWPQGEPVEAA